MSQTSIRQAAHKSAPGSTSIRCVLIAMLLAGAAACSPEAKQAAQPPATAASDAGGSAGPTDTTGTTEMSSEAPPTTAIPPPPPPPPAPAPPPPPEPSRAAAAEAGNMSPDEPAGGAGSAPSAATPVQAPQFHVSAPTKPLRGPENKDITLLLSLNLSAAQLQAYYDDRFKSAEAPALQKEGTLEGFQSRFTHLSATIDCGDGRVITCKPMDGYPSETPARPGVMTWRWNVVGVDDPNATGNRAQSVHIVVKGSGSASGPWEAIDSIPDIRQDVSVAALNRMERLIAAWTHLADSIKALLIAVIAMIGVLTAWLRSLFKKDPPAS